ncbi:hypothetical protein AKJ09_06928 [Labilithrix luteola]|uniref:Uncharacterized protein n=1 Tax=Labilithrix luteola TaxID=1391654 RepID=A0A0K1Q4F7_9BACT|nr:hypothetical protein AKJ09_06928 [Labilithrix luteola]
MTSLQLDDDESPASPPSLFLGALPSMAVVSPPPCAEPPESVAGIVAPVELSLLHPTRTPRTSVDNQE